MKTTHDPAAIKLLESIGFQIDQNAMNNPLFSGIHGNKAAEPVNLSPHHFTPAFRHVFVGRCVNGNCYATSHIFGELRLFRQHKKNTDKGASVRNVFGSGKSELEAVQALVENLTASPIRYNENSACLARNTW